MEEYNGENPQNARIKINYAGKKPKVKFSYPVSKKDSKTIGSMMQIVLLGWVLINLPLMIFIGLKEDSNSYENKEEYNLSNYSEFLNYYTQQERLDYFYDTYNKNYIENILDKKREIISFLYLILTPFIIYFPFKRRWDSLYPDFQAFTSKKKYRKFLIKDIKEENNNFYIELPIFENIICDFNATKDFSKYLELFEIEEHKFSYYGILRLKKKSKKQKNEFIWYARWYFKEKPIKGFLEVIYK